MYKRQVLGAYVLSSIDAKAVSYTHLDVYKRQAASYWLNGPANAATNSALDAVLGHHTYADYSSVLNGLTQTSDVRLDTKSAAIFGRLTWHLNEKLSIEPGLRYNYDQKDSYYNALVSGGLATTNSVLKTIQNNQLAPSFYVANFEDTNLSGDITLSYKACLLYTSRCV